MKPPRLHWVHHIHPPQQVHRRVKTDIIHRVCTPCFCSIKFIKCHKETQRWVPDKVKDRSVEERRGVVKRKVSSFFLVPGTSTVFGSFPQVWHYRDTWLRNSRKNRHTSKHHIFCNTVHKVYTNKFVKSHEHLLRKKSLHMSFGEEVSQKCMTFKIAMILNFSNLSQWQNDCQIDKYRDSWMYWHASHN